MEINRILKRSGTLWAADYYDRFIRDEDHYYKCRSYIRMNPVKAKLCENPEDWEFSSAWKERGL
jgi:REP element-mobilizing transposase RayT